MGASINGIADNSIAAELGLEAGDLLQSVNGKDITDIIDYRYQTADSRCILEIQKHSREQWTLEIEKDIEEDLGLIFHDALFDGVRTCQNKCMFCFMEQLPAGMRKSLYIKDDDYRFSFLYGNFITLTNLEERDWEKITEMRLSPLYISLHCTEGALREKMMHNKKAAHIMRDLQRLKEAGIKMHFQIVLCPGINDGRILEQTISDVETLYPAAATIGIVPVGLTGHRDDLYVLNSFSGKAARELTERAERWQVKYRKMWDHGFVYLADEFYLKAGMPIPEDPYYDDYEQMENGIGLCRLLLDELDQTEHRFPALIDPPREVYLACGISAQPVIEILAGRLSQIDNLSVKVLPVPNRFFGGEVSVTGLLTGKDLVAAMGTAYRGQTVFLAEVVLKDGNDILLDDMSIDELKIQTGADIQLTDGSISDLLNKILPGWEGDTYE